MTKTVYILLIIILLWAFSINTLASPIYVFLEKKKISKITTIKIGSREYISYNQFAKIIFKKKKFKINSGLLQSISTQSSRKSFKIAEGSFFMVFESINRMKVLQMTMPVIRHYNKLYLPMPDIIKIAVENDLIAATFEGNKLIFRKLPNEIYDTYDYDTYSDYHIPPQNKQSILRGYRLIDSSTVNMMEKNTIVKPNYQRLLKQKYIYRKQQERYIAPTGYQIPKEIKRKNVEKLKTIDN